MQYSIVTKEALFKGGPMGFKGLKENLSYDCEFPTEIIQVFGLIPVIYKVIIAAGHKNA